MQIIQSKLLNSYSKLRTGFTTKKQGNIAFHVNDDEENVLINHKQLAYLLEYDLQSLVHMKQIHSNIVHHITSKDNFTTPPTCDAIITDKKNTPLMVMVADCSPILFFDEKKNVIAVAHAGRAGAFNNIVKNVIDTFIQLYNSDTLDIKVSIGANIKECCYEVGKEIFQEVQELGLEYSINKKDDSFFLDISSILNSQLKENGISSKNIEFIDICTSCNKEHFSYRREKVTGREAGVIMLLEN